MKVLITGAFGNVGRSTVEACLASGDELTLLETDTAKNRHLERRLRRHWPKTAQPPVMVYGDIRDPALVASLVENQDAIIHLAAVIPPTADVKVNLAKEVNIGGTVNLIKAAQAQKKPPRLVYASSIAAYGDRLDDYWISASDPLTPSPGDHYAATKIEAETLVRSSGLEFVILRLSAIIWVGMLKPDPLFFHMPLRTKMEICHTKDTGVAFAHAARRAEALGGIFNIGGGPSCRTDYHAFLKKMFAVMGLGDIDKYPVNAFASADFHCGWYRDSELAQQALDFWQTSLEDLYAEIALRMRFIRPLASLVSPLIRRRILSTSPFYQRH